MQVPAIIRSLWNRVRIRPKVGGYIHYYKLDSWWHDAFSDEERQIIAETFKPTMGRGGEKLTAGTISMTSQSASGFLSVMGGWFKKEPVIAIKILEESIALAVSSRNVLDEHFAYTTLVRTLPRKPEYQAEVIRACERHIETALESKKAFLKEYPGDALPHHVGFYELVGIYQRQHRHDDAIRLCLQAQKQGWSGNWPERIERLQAAAGDAAY